MFYFMFYKYIRFKKLHLLLHILYSIQFNQINDLGMAELKFMYNKERVSKLPKLSAWSLEIFTIHGGKSTFSS